MSVLTGFLKLLAVVVAAWGLVVLAVWRFQERIAFPAPRGSLPDPPARRIPDGERVEVIAADNVALRGWYLPPNPGPAAGSRAPGLIWFSGNAEMVSMLAPVIRELRPPGVGLLMLDYRGYGASGGRPTEAGIYRDAEAAWAFLAARSEIDSARIGVYGRSLGSAPALHLATTRAVRAVVLEAPFTDARAMARVHYPFVPRLALRLSFDNLSRARRLTAPLLVIHGLDDRVVPFAMGRAVAEAGRARELVAVEGADHNDLYAVAGGRYREAFHRFLGQYLR